MTGASGASRSGALRVVICWQNWPSPKLMMLRRRVRFDGSLMGPPILQTALGEQRRRAPTRAQHEGDETGAPPTARRRAAASHRGGEHSVITCDAMTSKVAVLGRRRVGNGARQGARRQGRRRRLSGRAGADLCEAVNASRENARYLPGARLPANLACTDDLGAALDGATHDRLRRAEPRDARGRARRGAARALHGRRPS